MNIEDIATAEDLQILLNDSSLFDFKITVLKEQINNNIKVSLYCKEKCFFEVQAPFDFSEQELMKKIILNIFCFGMHIFIERNSETKSRDVLGNDWVNKMEIENILTGNKIEFSSADRMKISFLDKQNEIRLRTDTHIDSMEKLFEYSHIIIPQKR